VLSSYRNIACCSGACHKVSKVCSSQQAVSDDDNLPLYLQILLAFSDNQIADCMLLRRLYYTKQGLLAMKRKELVSQISSTEEQAQHPCEHVVTMSDLATCLKDNSAENHQVHYRVARVLYRGVSHSCCCLCPVSP